jgi:exopolysaccharide biosynthesis operon protein EpsL
MELLVIVRFRFKLGLGLWCFLAMQAHAEGIIDFQPFVRAGMMYDDNLFRFSSKAQANAAGFSTLSDTVKTLDAGAQVNLRLSRQMVRATASISDNQHNRYDFLDNTAKSYGITWDWRLGNSVYGDLNTSLNQSVAGFNDTDIVLRNLRTVKRQRASINWNVLSTWTLYGLTEKSDLENDELAFQPLDREDNSYELGTRYLTTSGTQVGLFYRYLKSDYVSRSGSTALIFGRENDQKQVGVNLAWVPTLKTRVTGQISTIRFQREDALQDDFNGLSQRWNVDYAWSGKTSFGFTAYRELASVDDLLSTYVLFKGASANVNWRMTSKLSLNASYGVGEREFLGGSSIFFSPLAREDSTKRFGFNVAYTPTDHALLQLRFVDEDRDSNLSNFAYQFQSIQLVGQYNF